MNITTFICIIFGLVAIGLLFLAYAIHSTMLGVLGSFILLPVIACASFHLNEYIKSKNNE